MRIERRSYKGRDVRDQCRVLKLTAETKAEAAVLAELARVVLGDGPAALAADLEQWRIDYPKPQDETEATQ